MKTYIIRLALLFGVLCTAACSGDLMERPSHRTDGQGVATFSIDLARTRAAQLAEQEACDIRIYKYNSEGAKELIRHYFSIADMPESLWLLAGTYHISVALDGDKRANFDDPTYFGETDFTIAAGASSAVAVTCTIRNTMIEVVYDDSIAAHFDEDYRTIVAVADNFDASSLTTTDHLEYGEAGGRGYFTLPADAERISYCFLGNGSKVGELHMPHAVRTIPADQREGYLYRLTFRYSADQGGYVAVEVSIDTKVEEVDDTVGFNPSPKPTIAGDGFDLKEAQPFDGVEAVTYTITPAGSEIETVTIAVDATRALGGSFEVDCTSAGDKGNGIAVAIDGDKTVSLSLDAAFFNQLAGGEHLLTFTATAKSKAEATAQARVLCSGACGIASTNGWMAEGEVSAVVYYAAPAEVQLQYRTRSTEEWSTAEAVSAGENRYTARAEEIHANTTYECQLLIGGTPVGAICAVTMGNGPQLPNAGFETWTKPGNAWLPYDDSLQFWDTGNHGSTTLGPNYNITTGDSDARPDSEGTTSARMASRNVVVKFAAGNIFAGTYLGTAGTNGVIGFSQPFDYTYRPKQVKFWYKGTVGTIDKTDSKSNPPVQNGASDVAQFYVMLCKMDGPHIVNSADQGTFMDITSHTISYCSAVNGTNSKNDQPDGHVIAIASWENTQSKADWEEITLDFTYYEEYEGEVPTRIIVTASASKYGDYFTGSTKSVMYLDDVELVY